jgi:tetratricopeptide (TPR) repeat protein
MSPLDFVQDRATQLWEALQQPPGWALPGFGGWLPAGSGNGLVLNPTVAQTRSFLQEAFADATEREATLLVALIGHGITVDGEFYFMTTDAPDPPDTESALPMVKLLGSLIEDSEDIDGLILLVDTCQAGSVVTAMGHDWIDTLRARRSRMDLLVASDDQPAYDGKFTATIVDLLGTGVPGAGDGLVCADLEPILTERCRSQVPQRLSYSDSVTSRHDRSLVLVPNVQRRHDALRGRPGAGVVDQLANPDILVVTPSLRRALTELQRSVAGADDVRLRIVRGPAGCGKSTSLALLVRPDAAVSRPELHRGLAQVLTHRSDVVKAAAFLDSSTTLDVLAEEIATQLSRTVLADPYDGTPAFADILAAVDESLTEQQRAELSSWQRQVVMPLARLAPQYCTPIVLDGLDQPQVGAAALIAAGLAELVVTEGCENVRLVAGLRSPPDGGDGESLLNALVRAEPEIVDVDAPTLEQIREAIRLRLTATTPAINADTLTALLAAEPDGGWILARLFADLTTITPTGRPTWMHDNVILDELISARITSALDPDRGGDPELTQRILALCAAAGVGPVLPISLLATAGAPADSDEPLLLARVRNCLPALGALLARGQPGTEHETLGLAHDLYVTPAATHLGDVGADADLDWAHQKLVATVTADYMSQLTESGRGAIEAYWRRAAPRHYLAVGDPRDAYDHLKQQDATTGVGRPRAAENRDRWSSWLQRFTETCGSRHEETLTARSMHAYWQGEAGDYESAIENFVAVIDDMTQELSPGADATLATRQRLASCRGDFGDVHGAVADYEALLGQLLDTGRDNTLTVVVTNNLARWRAEISQTEQAATFQQLLEGRDVANDPVAMGILSNMIGARASSGQLTAPEAAAEYSQLLNDQISFYGSSEHEDVLRTRHNLAHWRGEAGELGQAVEEFQSVLEARNRMLDEDDVETLATRSEIAYFLGRSGHYAAARSEFEALLESQRRLMRPDREILTTQRNLARLRGEAGDPAAAVTECEQLLERHEKVYGPGDARTMRNRANLARFRAEAGNPTQAVAELKALLEEQTSALGGDHPDTVDTRGLLARAIKLADTTMN